MLRTANMIVGDRDIAEDVVQDALIQVWQHLPALRDAGALRSWLTRIVVNQCISFKRRLARSTAFIRQSLADQETNILAQVADDHKGRMERDWDLAQAIKNLPVKQRTVIVLHYYSGMTLPEMTQTLRISENTLKKRIQAALSNLRRTLHASDMDDAYAPSSTSKYQSFRIVLLAPKRISVGSGFLALASSGSISIWNASLSAVMPVKNTIKKTPTLRTTPVIVRTCCARTGP